MKVLLILLLACPAWSNTQKPEKPKTEQKSAKTKKAPIVDESPDLGSLMPTAREEGSGESAFKNGEAARGLAPVRKTK